MKEIKELLRLPSPAPRPQPLAFDGEYLWMGSWDTFRIYALDPQKWTVREETQGPSKPFGMTVIGDELRIVRGVGENDDRYIYRFVPGHGFKDEGRIPCPELTGSNLGYDGDTLFLSQAEAKRILALDAAGTVLRTIQIDRKILGMVIVDARFHLITTDDEFEDVRLTRVDSHGETPTVEHLASIPFDARSLAYDGTRFWTSDRENHQIVAFELT